MVSGAAELVVVEVAVEVADAAARAPWGVDSVSEADGEWSGEWRGVRRGEGGAESVCTEGVRLGRRREVRLGLGGRGVGGRL